MIVGNWGGIVGDGNEIVGGGGSGEGRGNESFTRTRESAVTEGSGSEAWSKDSELRERDLG